jgi:hypothetical protein
MEQATNSAGETTVRPAVAFLCHSSADKPVVREVADALRKAGVAVWIDEVELRIGDSLIDRLSEAIHTADLIVAFISATSVTSAWVGKELSLAMTREVNGRRVRVLPVVVNECELPYSLRDKLYADLRGTRDRTAEIARLINAVSQHAHSGGIAGEPGGRQGVGPIDLGAVMHDRGRGYQGFRSARTDKTVGTGLMVVGVATSAIALILAALGVAGFVTNAVLAGGALVFVGGALLASAGALLERAFDFDRRVLLEVEAVGPFSWAFDSRWRQLYKLSAANRYHRCGLLLETVSLILLTTGPVALLAVVLLMLWHAV